MATPKKKLPTGPIRIQAPATKKAETATIQASETDNILEETTNLEPVKQESTKQESFTAELPIETSNHAPINQTEESQKQESSFIEASKPDAVITDVQTSQPKEITNLLSIEDSTSQESSFQESYLQDIEFKKVAMRLSAEAVAKLQQFRAFSGIPYEILVDVMIRNWDNLPQRTQNSYLQQAKQLRVQRLMAGQEKTMQTMKAKYLK